MKKSVNNVEYYKSYCKCVNNMKLRYAFTLYLIKCITFFFLFLHNWLEISHPF